ncbi:PREDICTED: WD repeat-containing protein CG11141 isoform X1 [Nicrophorus vespilloides]|uniref:WD repeat-containing protein CG11141 isoform X1 n=1 Tax=Nicrophorus vespilloides TaxID=110193 RepID=A0ABM1MTT8_NICVS|nr:PREDICTED: WD repeat-containing protein CG11141 isoform X1 [Nicrophorus vespilloides]
MALSACEQEIVLREWAPLTDLFQKLPTRSQNGIFNTELKIYCIDAITEYLVLGTSSGVVYIYDRKKLTLQRLRCENVNSPVSCVKIVSSVDFMICCGSQDGTITIFQVPKTPPDTLPESLRPETKPVERYTVTDMHSAAVTAIEWSKNGMKVFSGDANGIVILTEIDDYMHLCKSAEVLNEAYKVVQLSYHQQNLLVSTTYRTILCRRDNKWSVSQVGKKDRKIFGQFGSLFCRNGISPSDIIIYSSRPGLRLWVADANGSVQKTLLFKEVLSDHELFEVPLLNPFPANLENKRPSKEASFGPLIQFCENYLITYSDEVVYVLSPQHLKIVAVITHLRKVCDVAVNKDEIFILEGERSLIRVAFTPEMEIENRSSVNSSPLKTSIKSLTNKMQASTILAATVFQSDQNISRAEEARESPSNKYIPHNPSYTEKVYDAYRKMEVYNKISEQQFDETILFKRGRSKKSDTMTTSVYSNSSNSSNDERDSSSITKPTVMNLSATDMMPDLRSPDSIHNDIVQKEKLLADVLKFDQVKVDLKQLDKPKLEILDYYESRPEKKDETKDIPDIITSSRQETLVIQDEPCITQKSPVEQVQDINRISPIKSATETINKPQIQKIDIPACQTLPNNWNVYKISLGDSTTSPDISLTEWEVI